MGPCMLLCLVALLPSLLLPSSVRDTLDSNKSSEHATLPENVDQAIEEVRAAHWKHSLDWCRPKVQGVPSSFILLLSFLKLLWRSLCTAGKRELKCACTCTRSVVYGGTSVCVFQCIACMCGASCTCGGFSDLLRSEALVDEVRQGLRSIAMAMTERAAKVHLHIHTCAHTDSL